MAVAGISRVHRTWLARPARPIWYGPAARAADWWTAERDARVGLPRLEEDGTVGTPRWEELGRGARDRAEREWLRYQVDCADLLVRVAGVRGRMRAARERLRDAADQLAAVPERLSTEELETRRAGEARRKTDVTVIRARRAREHARLRAPLQARLRQATDELATLAEQLAGLESRVQVRFQVAQTRARRIDEHARRRGAAYMGRLVRRHPQGGRVNAAWKRDWPELPDWVYGDRSPHLSGPSETDPGGDHGT
jgi:hypothetical protein